MCLPHRSRKIIRYNYDRHKKLVVVGSAGCGKTCLVATLRNGTFPKSIAEQPALYEDSTRTLTVDGVETDLHMFDTGTDPDFIRFRVLSYTSTDIFLVCFDVTDRDSFNEVAETLLPEIGDRCFNVPYILVGLKTDWRPRDQAKPRKRKGKDKAPASGPVSTKEGRELMKEIGARDYLEVSALKGDGVQQVLESAVRASRKAISYCR